jgi:hypothetical protein
MKSQCVAYPEDEPLVLIRASQVRICDGNHCAAALLSYFGYWHSNRTGNVKQAEHANKMAALHGEIGTQDTRLLQYHTEEEIEEGLLQLYGRKTIRVALALLVSKGFLSLHENPNPRYRFDRTHYFLFHPTAVQAEIGIGTHQVKMPDREIQEDTQCLETESTMFSSQVIDISDKVKMPDREGENTSPSGKNAAPIAEITYREEETPSSSTNVEEESPLVDDTDKPVASRVEKAKKPKTIIPLSPQSWVYGLLQEYAESFDVQALNDQDWWKDMGKSFPEFTREFVSGAFADLANWLRANPRRVPRNKKGWLTRMQVSLNFYYDARFAKRGSSQGMSTSTPTKGENRQDKIFSNMDTLVERTRQYEARRRGEILPGAQEPRTLLPRYTDGGA